MLDFIGTGSAFNTGYGNNSAYIKKDNELLLIDCGGTTFGRIMEHDLLDGVEKITVLITHLHPDHIGSLGDLIFYSYYKLNPSCVSKVKIYAPETIAFDLNRVLNVMGVNLSLFDLIAIPLNGNIFDIQFPEIIYIAPVIVEHVSDLECYGYIIRFAQKLIYYSGDSNMIPNGILDFLFNGQLDQIYQDTCLADYEGNVHLSLRKLTELIPPEYRHRVYCMHLDDVNLADEATKLGFKFTYSWWNF